MKIFGIAGWSGSGKTTLLVRLIPALLRRGIEVATIKHTHHNPAMGDDESRALAAAGAREVLTGSSRRFALVHELGDAAEPDLATLVQRVAGVDLLLVEGFKFSSHPKLEVWAPHLGKPLLATNHPSVVAIATDGTLEGQSLPVFRRDNVEGLAEFIIAY